MSSNSNLNGLFKEIYADALHELFQPSLSYEVNKTETYIFLSDSVYLFVRPVPPKNHTKLVVWEE